MRILYLVCLGVFAAPLSAAETPAGAARLLPPVVQVRHADAAAAAKVGAVGTGDRENAVKKAKEGIASGALASALTFVGGYFVITAVAGAVVVDQATGDIAGRTALVEAVQRIDPLALIDRAVARRLPAAAPAAGARPVLDIVVAEYGLDTAPRSGRTDMMCLYLRIEAGLSVPEQEFPRSTFTVGDGDPAAGGAPQCATVRQWSVDDARLLRRAFADYVEVTAALLARRLPELPWQKP